MKKIIIIAAIVALVITDYGCKKFVEVDAPSTSLNEDIVFKQDATAIAVMTNIYANNLGNINFGLYSLTQYAGLSSDELNVHPSVLDAKLLSYYQNNLSPSQSGTFDFWINAYNNIFVANTVIEKLNNNSNLTPSVHDQLLGEARFLRGFMYFTLVNLFGDVPLNLTTDYRSNQVRPRTDKVLVYQQVVEDLKEAKALLSSNYLNASYKPYNERTRPNRYTATSLLARVYLYMKDYANAEKEATEVINNTALYSLAAVDEVFLKDSKEIIWSLQITDIGIGANTPDANLFILSDINPPEQSRVYLDPSLASAFTSLDKRKNWVGTYTDPVSGQQYNFPFKYKTGNVVSNSATEYPVLFRLAEQYLIRAEARGMQNNFSGAADDINMIRNRAGLSSIVIADESSLINAVLNERRLEFFTEWGHRWFDLIRLGKANEILGAVKGSSWQSTDQLYPIPQLEIDMNPALKGHQNPGY